jgi:hypothetical protein
MPKKLTKTDLFQDNIIGVKITEEKRSYSQTIGAARITQIRRTKYLKICWFCGQPYESNKHNSYACNTRCSANLYRQGSTGKNPPAKMDVLTKEKNLKEVKVRFGY